MIMEGMGHFPMIENYPVFRNSCCRSWSSWHGPAKPSPQSELDCEVDSVFRRTVTTFISRRELLRCAGLAGAAAAVARADLLVPARGVGLRPRLQRRLPPHAPRSNISRPPKRTSSTPSSPRLIPTDASGPGALEAGAARYIDRALGGPWPRRARPTAAVWPRSTSTPGRRAAHRFASLPRPIRTRF